MSIVVFLSTDKQSITEIVSVVLLVSADPFASDSVARPTTLFYTYVPARNINAVAGRTLPNDCVSFISVNESHEPNASKLRSRSTRVPHVGCTERSRNDIYPFRVLFVAACIIGFRRKYVTRARSPSYVGDKWSR